MKYLKLFPCAWENEMLKYFTKMNSNDHSALMIIALYASRWWNDDEEQVFMIDIYLNTSNAEEYD